MAVFLDTRGNSVLGVGICARCSIKMPLLELMPDRNLPGLMVCKADNDEFDPYRLPARQTEQINLPFVRPDTPIDLAPPVQGAVTAFETEDGLDGLETNNGEGLQTG